MNLKDQGGLVLYFFLSKLRFPISLGQLSVQGSINFELLVGYQMQCNIFFSEKGHTPFHRYGELFENLVFLEQDRKKCNKCLIIFPASNI